MMTMLSKKKVKAFLDELREITLKHGIVIEGCGCCGSPYIRPIKSGENNDWIYTVDEYNGLFEDLTFEDTRNDAT